MATSMPKSPGKPKSPPTNPSEIVQSFIDKHPDYQVTYKFMEEGEKNAKRFQFFYKMGERDLARGHYMTNKQEAKNCAAHMTEKVLRSEGYRLCGTSLESCTSCAALVPVDEPSTSLPNN